MVLVVNLRGLEEAGLTKSYNQEVVDYHLDPLPLAPSPHFSIRAAIAESPSLLVSMPALRSGSR